MGKIEIGLICYQISLIAKADHYDLRSDGAIIAFKTVAKRRNKNIQLCVYQEKQEKQLKHKKITYGSAIENLDSLEINSQKKICERLILVLL